MITVVVLVLLRIRMLILLSLLLHYRLICSCLLWKNIATTKRSVDTECVQCTSLSSQAMVPLVSLVMVNIYTCFQTPYIRSIRKKVTFVSRLIHPSSSLFLLRLLPCHFLVANIVRSLKVRIITELTKGPNFPQL